MDRELLFRGFHKYKNGKDTIYLNEEEIEGNWVYGFYVTNLKYLTKDEKEAHFIIEDGYEIYDYWNDYDRFNTTAYYEAIPDTIGQYTFLDDKNGKKIFENDVVVCSWLPEFKGYVTFIDGGYYLHEVDGNRCISFSEVVERSKGNLQGNIEVIGTIFDKEDIL